MRLLIGAFVKTFQGQYLTALLPLSTYQHRIVNVPLIIISYYHGLDSGFLNIVSTVQHYSSVKTASLSSDSRSCQNSTLAVL